MDRIAGFDWDDGNREKCQRHGVSIAEIESVFLGRIIIIPDHKHSGLEWRMRAIGKAASGRHAFIVFTLRRSPRGELIRPISARYMHRKEIATHEKANPGFEEDPLLPKR